MGAYSVVAEFEQEIAEWAGAKYGVAVESCTMAIFLCLLYEKTFYSEKPSVWIPNKTYPGVAMSIINAGYNLNLEYYEWETVYRIRGSDIFDSALRLSKNMFNPDNTYFPGRKVCLSFHYKKHLPIGRGGMILTDDIKAVEWLKMARFDGRKEKPLSQDNATIVGWNAYMTPEQAARGLALFEAIKDKDLPDLKVKDQNYPDLSTWRCFK